MSNHQRLADHDPARLVGKFLLSHGYLETLEAFSNECNIKITDFRFDEEGGEQVTLESLLEERRLRELSIEMAKARLAESEIPGWSDGCPATPVPLPLKTSANVLFVTVNKVLGFWSVLVSTADKALRIYDYQSLELRQEYTYLHSSPILEARVLSEKWLLTAGMDGKVVVTDLAKQDIYIESLENAHSRYVNRLVVNDKWIATSGYDKKINLYEIVESTDSALEIVFRASVLLATLPEGLLFTDNDDQTVLAVCARDTCFLEYYMVPTLELQRRLNMNQNKDLWVSFSGVDLSQQPTGPRYLGLSTSTSPYGRWLAFEVGNEEMKANIFHGAPQSDLGVLPRHVWRPDGSGFWVREKSCK